MSNATHTHHMQFNQEKEIGKRSESEYPIQDKIRQCSSEKTKTRKNLGSTEKARDEMAMENWEEVEKKCNLLAETRGSRLLAIEGSSFYP